ncbi:MAG: pyridoxal phosphate-dependent aminotransferase [Paracoccaceae bacterium]
MSPDDHAAGPETGPALSRTARGLLGTGGDDGWRLYRRANALKREGRAVLNLAVGEHDRPAPAAAIEALVRAAREGPHGYAALGGTPRLREAVARRLGRFGPAPDPEAVHVTFGAQAALRLAVALALDPGDECVILDPYYAPYPQTVRAAGGVPVAVPTTGPSGGFQPDPEAIARAIGPRTRAIVLNTPNNPTGAVYERARLAAVAALCRRHDLWCIADEVYDALVHDGVHCPVRALEGMAGRTLTCGALSKGFAMTGWRVGWLVGPERAIARAGDLAVADTYGLPPFVQAGALAALEEAVDVEAEIAAETAERARAALDALPPGGAVRASPPQGAMYLMLDLSGVTKDAGAFAEALLEAEGIACLPGASFGSAAPACLRLALVAPAPALADAVARLARFADAWHEDRTAP